MELVSLVHWFSGNRCKKVELFEVMRQRII